MPYSAGRPSFGAAVVTFAGAAMNRRSQNRATASPTPAAAPLTAAISDVGQSELEREVVVELGPHAVARRRQVAAQPVVVAAAVGVPGERLAVGADAERRWRAGHDDGADRSSAASSARIQRYSACIRPVHALCRWGRCSHTVATPPSTS